MRYANEQELLARLDRIIKAKVKHYVTDWTEIDRPAFLEEYADFQRKGTRAIGYDAEKGTWTDSNWVLIARECGTYLLPWHGVIEDGTIPATIYDYYAEHDGKGNQFWMIDFIRLEVAKLDGAKVTEARLAG